MQLERIQKVTSATFLSVYIEFGPSHEPHAADLKDFKIYTLPVSTYLYIPTSHSRFKPSDSPSTGTSSLYSLCVIIDLAMTACMIA